jgi:hypothetical protein
MQPCNLLAVQAVTGIRLWLIDIIVWMCQDVNECASYHWGWSTCSDMIYTFT